MIKEKDIIVKCADGHELAATLFTPETHLKGAVMIAPATGIKRAFYYYFAQFLCRKGYGVISFDNRGIGDSLKGDIRESTASLQLWGERDLPAVLQALQRYFPRQSYHLVGHSAGGQLVGLMYNHHLLSSMFNVACSSGRIRNMKFPFNLRARFFMDIYIPLNNLFFGYVKTHLIGMGEALPKKVAQEWREWCNGQAYVKTAFGKTIHRHWYDEVEMPSFWLNATDDDIAIDENVDDMLSIFPKLKVERLKLSPHKQDLKEIGHMRFFSRQNMGLWKLALQWLNKQEAKQKIKT